MNKLILTYKKLSLPVKASLWYMMCSVLQKGISVITTPVFTRLLTTDQYGLVSIYNSWEAIITVFATLNFTAGVYNNAMVRYEKDRDGYTSVLQIWTTIWALGLLVVYFLTSTFWNGIFELSTPLIVAMFVDIIATSAMSFWSVRNRYEFKYLSVCVVTLVASVLAPTVSMILVYSTEVFRGEAKIIGTVIVHVIVYGIVYAINLYRGKKLLNKEYIIYSTKFNIPLIPHYLSQNVLSQADRVMISSMCSIAKAGIYSVAYQAGFLINIVTSAINGSFVPLLYESMKNKEYKKINKIVVSIEVFVGTICFWFSLFAPEVIKILATEEYYEAIWIIPPVSMSSLLIMMYSFFANIQFYFGRTKFIMVSSVSVAALNILLNWLFISKLGYIAAGYTTLICYLIYAYTQYLFMKWVCKREKSENPYNGKLIWSMALFFVVMSIVSTMLYKMAILRYIVIVLLFVAAIIVGILKKKIIVQFLERGKR